MTDYAQSLSWSTPNKPWDTQEPPQHEPEVAQTAAPETAITEPVEPVEEQVPTDDVVEASETPADELEGTED